MNESKSWQIIELDERGKTEHSSQSNNRETKMKKKIQIENVI